MPNILTKDGLRNEILELLKRDDRTLGQLGQVMDALHILERPDAVTGPNWEIARSVELKRLPSQLQTAMAEAEANAQANFRLNLRPPGIQC